MSANTSIEWAHHTFNPWWGCEKLSPACAHCYAEAWAKRTGHDVWGENAPRRFFGDRHWKEPLKWDRAAAAAGDRARVFCASMADVLEDRLDLIGERQRLVALIERTPNLDWMLLTKRPENARKLLPSRWFDGEWPSNCWFGVTVENQRYADMRIPIALEVPAPIHFLSCEPLLGAVQIAEYLPNRLWNDVPSWEQPQIDLVIAGGESGPGARPMHPSWVRSLRDQCVNAGVAFHFKQWGEWTPSDEVDMSRGFEARWKGGALRGCEIVDQDGERYDITGADPVVHEGEAIVVRVGKKAAGRELDGRTWDQMPDQPRRHD